jgi:hypothetical protein
VGNEGGHADIAPCSSISKPRPQPKFEHVPMLMAHCRGFKQRAGKDDVMNCASNFEVACIDSEHRRRAKALVRMLEAMATMPWRWRRDLDRMEENVP